MSLVIKPTQKHLLYNPNEQVQECERCDSRHKENNLHDITEPVGHMTHQMAAGCWFLYVSES